mgnify:CR=1 FL=1
MLSLWGGGMIQSPYLQPPLAKPPLRCLHCDGPWAHGEHHRKGQVSRYCYPCGLMCLPGYDGRLRLFDDDASVAGAAAHAVLDLLWVHHTDRRIKWIERLASHLRISIDDTHVSHMNTLGRLTTMEWAAGQIKVIAAKRAQDIQERRSALLETMEGGQLMRCFGYFMRVVLWPTAAYLLVWGVTSTLQQWEMPLPAVLGIVGLLIAFCAEGFLADFELLGTVGGVSDD